MNFLSRGERDDCDALSVDVMVEVHDPRQPIDHEWDDWLQSVPTGQFQQSSGWAAVKHAEGWQCVRVKCRRQGALAAGFQLLHKRSRLGRVGYIAKGPAFVEGLEGLVPCLVASIRRVAADLGLVAVMLQAPDVATHLEPELQAVGFMPERRLGVISASLWFRLGKDQGELLTLIPKETRNPIRQSQRRGLRIKVGSETDLPRFFALMEQTCRRQGVAPNPGSLAALKLLYGSFQRVGCVEIGLAERGDAGTVAGLLCIYFGHRMTIWKKGWDGTHPGCRPNHGLYYWAMERAIGRGAQFCDFAGLDRAIAERLLSRQPLSQEQVRSRDQFHLSFGGDPRLLPEARLWFRHPVLRSLHGIYGWFLRPLNPIPVGHVAVPVQT